ncbi:MAG TPA: conjugative transfer signal peptidase TraF [Longimicrobium sp.]
MGGRTRGPRPRRLGHLRPRLAAVALVAPLVFLYGFRLTYNSTESLPIGIYQVRELRGAPARGDVVGFCLEGEFARLAMNRGYVHREGLELYVYGTRCASGAAVIGKPVAGLPGDTVEVRRSGVWINGVPVANSQVIARDHADREMPHPRWGRHVLARDEYWLQSTHSERSFDSRYYGPVRRSQILDRRTPLLVR